MNRMDNDVVISVENVTMAFNLNKEKVDNLKEYVIHAAQDHCRRIQAYGGHCEKERRDCAFTGAGRRL